MLTMTHKTYPITVPHNAMLTTLTVYCNKQTKQIVIPLPSTKKCTKKYSSQSKRNCKLVLDLYSKGKKSTSFFYIRKS